MVLTDVGLETWFQSGWLERYHIFKIKGGQNEYLRR